MPRSKKKTQLVVEGPPVVEYQVLVEGPPVVEYQVLVEGPPVVEYPVDTEQPPSPAPKRNREEGGDSAMSQAVALTEHPPQQQQQQQQGTPEPAVAPQECADRPDGQRQAQAAADGGAAAPPPAAAAAAPEQTAAAAAAADPWDFKRDQFSEKQWRSKRTHARNRGHPILATFPPPEGAQVWDGKVVLDQDQQAYIFYNLENKAEWVPCRIDGIQKETKPRESKDAAAKEEPEGGQEQTAEARPNPAEEQQQTAAVEAKPADTDDKENNAGKKKKHGVSGNFVRGYRPGKEGTLKLVIANHFKSVAVLQPRKH